MQLQGQSLLKKIEKDVRQYAQVLSSILKVDVDIVDNHLFRIAGTGRFVDRLGTFIEAEGTGFKWVLENKKMLIIENPREEVICKHCPTCETCQELFEICCPIKLEEEVIGAIALACFQEEQKKLIFQNLDGYVDFLVKIAELIASKVGEAKNYQSIIATSQMLEKVMQFVTQGVVIFNSDNTLKYINQYAERILGNNKKQLDYLYKINEFKIFTVGQKKGNSEIEYVARVGQKKIRLFGYSYPISIDESNYGKVYIFQDIASIQEKIIIQDKRKYSFQSIIGEDKKILQVKEEARTLAKTDKNILIYGESGTGKEILARAIHSESDYREQPFIPIICTGVIESILEQEIFGNSENNNLSKIELMKEGTLFLDEVADLPLRIQGELLQLLQDKERFSGRIIASTSKNIENLISENRFRRDLYYFFYPFIITIPPLRERRQDIPVLIRYFLERYAYLEKKQITIDKKAYAYLLQYAWAGNVREMENIISFIVLMNQSGKVELDDINQLIDLEDQNIDGSFCLETIEKNTIKKAMDLYGNTTDGKRKVAKVLGISPATLYRKLRQYGIHEEKSYTIDS